MRIERENWFSVALLEVFGSERLTRLRLFNAQASDAIKTNVVVDSRLFLLAHCWCKKPSTRCLAAEAGARTEGFIKRRETEGHTTSNLFYIQHMQTEFAAHPFFPRIGCLETSSAQLSLDFMIRRSKDVQG